MSTEDTTRHRRISRSKRRWQFSLRASMVFMAVVAAIVAFVANYPSVALIIIGGTVWGLFQSGAIFDAVVGLSRPRVYVRYPVFAMVTWFLVGTISFAITGGFCWVIIHARSASQFWPPMIPGSFFAILSLCCYRLLWVYGRRAKGAHAREHQTSDSSKTDSDAIGD